MRFGRLQVFPVVMALLLAACGTGAPPTVPGDPGTTARGSALATRSPTTEADAGTGVTPRPSPTTTITAPLTSAAVDTPVVHLFYAVHVHAQDEWSPYRDPGLTDLDVAAARGYADQVDAIARTLDEHGARGSFHFTFGTAAGLCEFDPGFFDDLERRGHEIGIHAHANAFLLRAADEMRAACGRDIATGSGLVAMAGGREGTTRPALGESLQVFRDVGATQLLVNLSGECGTTSRAGNALVPWRADPRDVCAPDRTGILLVDQVSLEAVLTDGAPADVFSTAEFSTLAGLARAAVDEAAARPSDSVVVWGFVTHTGEYVAGNSPLAAVEPVALDGLDGLLTAIDAMVATGRARWSTGAEIAARFGG